MISVIVLLSCSVMSYIIFTCKDVDMGLDVAAYTVLEDDRSVEVCASIMAGSLGVPVNVLLVTTDGTATGEVKSATNLLNYSETLQ